MKSHFHSGFLFFVLVFNWSSLHVIEGRTKKTVFEPESQSVEPAPIEGDCPCSKIACVADKGPKGDTGDAGAAGPKGDQGAAGLKGPRGEKGQTGPRGQEGPPGLPGKQGAPGNDGKIGPSGEKGLQGAEGGKGDKGARGPIGGTGKQGVKGDKGDVGDKGDKGDHGNDGSLGPVGPAGAVGAQGPQGIDGPPGPDGKLGPTGPNGKPGLRGLMGPQGPKGDRGSQGPQGKQGADGKPGLGGAQGVRGPQGIVGSCSSQCADTKAQLVKEIEKLKRFAITQVNDLQKQIDELKFKPTKTPNHAILGSKNNPALSCKQIKQQNIRVRSGSYYVVTQTPARKSRVFCYMESLGMCAGGGWTPVMKLNGNKPTFRYTSPLWTNKAEYQPHNGLSGFGARETKLATYWSTPFTRLCVGMRTEHYSLKLLRIDYSASSLYNVIADGRYKPTRIGRDGWKRLVQPASLQRNCNREGFNVDLRHGNSIAARARIGIASNQQPDCASCDSRIGFGTDGSLCNQHTSNSCGNEARCSSDNGDRSTKTYGYIFVQ